MPDTSPERKRLRGQIARATGMGEYERADLLRAELLTVKIQEMVNAAPPLTDEQRARLAELLLPPTPPTRRGKR